MKTKASTIRTVGILSICLPFWFAIVYFIMSSIRPEYSHYTKAISELGSVDAPNRWVWNVCGYILPGMIVAMLGFAIATVFQNDKGIRLASVGLIVSGLLMAMSGVFPGDFDNRSSFTMVMHAIGSFGSFIGFLICGFSLPRIMRLHSNWASFVWPSLVLILLSIVTGFLRTGDMPGLGQRLGFACFFFWVGLIGFAMSRNASPQPNKTI